MTKKITKDMHINKILEVKPEAAKLMVKYGIHCIGCAAAHFETLEEGCRAHGMDNLKINELIKEINELKETQRSFLKQE